MIATSILIAWHIKKDHRANLHALLRQSGKDRWGFPILSATNCRMELPKFSRDDQSSIPCAPSIIMELRGHVPYVGFYAPSLRRPLRRRGIFRHYSGIRCSEMDTPHPIRALVDRPLISWPLRGHPSPGAIIRGPMMGDISDIGYAHRCLPDGQFPTPFPRSPLPFSPSPLSAEI